MQIKRDADSSLPSLHQSKRRGCDAGETSADPSVLSPCAPPRDEVANVLSATSVMPMHSLRSRVDACITNDSQCYAPAKLSFDIRIAINRFLASPSAPHMLHRAIGGGPVAYVFLSRVYAKSLFSRVSPAAAVSVDTSEVLTSPLSRIGTTTPHDQDAIIIPATYEILTNAVIVYAHWIDLILNGTKTWEIRSLNTTKKSASLWPQ